MEPDRAGRSAADLDGLAVATPAAPAAVTAAAIDEIEEALKDVVDPELGVNIVDLGLVYDLHLEGGALTIDMTLTSAACPLTDMIEDQISMALTGQEPALVADYTINWVWLPPWDMGRITEDGREQLRALGFNV